MSAAPETVETPSIYDTLPKMLADACLSGVDIGDLLGYACSEGARLLPRGMDLTANRSGSWEASHIEGLTAPDAVMEGPGAQPLDVDCDRCGASPGDGCWNPRTYDDNKHPHRERIATAKLMTVYSPGWGWTG